MTYDDGTGTGRSVTSEATERVDREGTLTVSPSPPVAGEVVTATLTDGDGMVTVLVWKWERSPRGGTPASETIIGAASSTYTPSRSADGGQLLRVTVSYDDAIGTGRVVASPATLPVDRLGVVSLSTGKPVAGEDIKAQLTDDDGGILNESWRWERSPGTGDPEWGVISGAGSSGYTTAPYDVGKRLRVVVTYTDGTGTARGATSPATNRVDQRGVVGLSTSVPDVGIEVIATLADADEGVTDAVWRWQRSPNAGTPSWSDITDASDASYTPTTPDEGTCYGCWWTMTMLSVVEEPQQRGDAEGGETRGDQSGFHLPSSGGYR